MNFETKLTKIDNKDETLRRLRCIEGHVAGIARMVESERSCPGIVDQISAVKGALDKVAVALLQQQIRTSLSRRDQSEDCKDLDVVLEDVAEILLDLKLR